MKQLVTWLSMGLMSICCHSAIHAQVLPPAAAPRPEQTRAILATAPVNQQEFLRRVMANHVSSGLHVTTPPTTTATATSHRVSNACNLVPNPSFDNQNVSNLSGYISNVFFLNNNPRDEVSDWMSTNGSNPDYYASNSPGPQSNPSSALISSFTPHDNDPTPGAHNGTIGLFMSSYDSEYITPRAGAITLTQGAYYAGFYIANGYPNNPDPTSYKVGLDLRSSSLGDPRTSANVKYTKTSTSIESQNKVTSPSWELVGGVIPNVSAGSYYVNIGATDPNSNPVTNALAYYLIDDIALYKIPTAGPNVTIPCGSTTATIGEGCTIPYATYEWTKLGTDFLLGSSIQLSVSPTVSTTYVLTVYLPGGSFYSSNVTVTPPAAPSTCMPPSLAAATTNASGSEIDVASGGNVCRYKDVAVSLYGSVDYAQPVTWQVVTPGPGRYSAVVSSSKQTYTVHSYVPNSSSPSSIPFQIKVTGTTLAGASFVLNFTYNSVYRLTPNGPVCAGPDARMDAIQQEETVQAYPNPATDKLILPKESTQAVLLNSYGQLVKQPDTSGAIDVRDLPAGLYNLRTVQDGKVVNQHIEVQH